MITKLLIAELAPTTIQFNGFWVVASFLAFFAANLAVTFGAMRKNKTEITPQPLRVEHDQGAASEKDCLTRYQSNEREIAALKTQRYDDAVAASIHRKSIYDKIESARSEMSVHTESVRKELADKIDDVPDRVIATLKNTGAI